jgi:hypothetical protein
MERDLKTDEQQEEEAASSSPTNRGLDTTMEFNADAADRDGETSQSDDSLDGTTSDMDTSLVISQFASFTSLSDDESNSRDRPRHYHHNHTLRHRDSKTSLLDKLHHRTPRSPHPNKIMHRKTKRRQKSAYLRGAYDFIQNQSQTDAQTPDTAGDL